MSQAKTPAPMGLENARAPVVGSSRTCPACQKPLEGRQEVACSGRCRAALSRQRRIQAQTKRDEQIAAAVSAAMWLLRWVADRLNGGRTGGGSQ